ncbi:MAG: LamG domain-containing protein [Candidatus Pacebacteria bacterium]|nr:LamG domain-containing protein [Candidatus Paceibacterota bacterium]
MKKNTSFTLIELLVVIVIIGVIAGVIMVTVSSSVSNATFARAKAFSSNVSNSMLLNLVSEWNFDEPQVGNITKDSWGVNDGTIYSTTTLIEYWNSSSGECVFGGCYEFSGDDYIDCGNVLSTANSYTFSFWGKITDLSNNKGILGFYGTSSNVGFSKINNDLLMFLSGNNYRYWNASNNSAIDSIENNWHFFTIIITGFNQADISNSKLYIDGTLMIVSSTMSTGTTSEVNNLIIGKNSYGNYLGSLDDVRVYNSILSSSQIKQNYIAGLNSLLGKGLISESEFKEKLSELSSNK